MHIEAIVIRKRPIREHDQMVVLYSRELGKITAIAKGSLRPQSRQALAIDEASHIACELVDGRSGAIMTSAQSMHALSSAKQHPTSWAAVQVFLQAIDLLVFEAQPDEPLWRSLIEILDELDAASSQGVLAVYRSGQQKLLHALGYGQHSILQQSVQWVRTSLDEQFETLAQRRLSSIDLFYDVAAMSSS